MCDRFPQPGRGEVRQEPRVLRSLPGRILSSDGGPFEMCTRIFAVRSEFIFSLVL